MSKKFPILVTGASGVSYGADIARGLVDKYDVFTMQRNPCSGIPVTRWLDVDFNEPQQIVQAIQVLDKHVGPLAGTPSLQAVIHCAAVSGKINYDVVMTSDISRVFAANVAEPLMLTKYLLDFGMLEWTGHVVFLMDPRNFGPELVVFEACKKALPLFVDTFSRHWPATLKVRFLVPPEKTRLGSVESIAEGVQDLIMDKYEGPILNIS